MSLLALPDELLLAIFSHLPAAFLLPVAQTYHRRLYHILQPLLAYSTRVRRNARLITQRLGPPQTYADDRRDPFAEAYADRDLATRFGAPFAPNADPDLGYRGLCGDLRAWRPYMRLNPPAPRYADGLRHPQIRALLAQAARLGVAFPPGFIRVMIAEALDNRGAPPGAFYTLARALVKVPDACDAGAGGFALRFLSDQQGCWYGWLYVAPGPDGGTHAVMYSVFDPSSGEVEEAGERAATLAAEVAAGRLPADEVARARALGVDIAKDMVGDGEVTATDFEEYVTRQWIQSRVWDTDGDGDADGDEDEDEDEDDDENEDDDDDKDLKEVEEQGKKAEGAGTPLPQEVRDFMWYNFTREGQLAYPRSGRYGTA